MKQNITVEQAFELSPKGQKKLRDWWKPQLFEPYGVQGNKKAWITDDGNIEKNSELVVPLLSIGRMIEFLDEHRKFLIKRMENRVDHANWYIESLTPGRYERLYYEPVSYIELIDALWEETKEVLEK